MVAAPRSGRAPRGTLDRTLILRTAGALMSADGLDAVTMRRIGTELGVRPMALYTYFRSKDEILAAIFDEMVLGIELPARGEGTLDDLRQIMRRYFHIAAEHSELIRLSTANSLASPGELRFGEALYDILDRQELDRRSALGLLATLTRFTVGCATLYPERRAWDEDPDYWPNVQRLAGSLPAAEFPVLRSFGTDLPVFTQEEVFTFGLELIIGTIPAPR